MDWRDKSACLTVDPELFFQYRPDTAARLIAALAVSPHAR